ncbi:hypothetical protein N7931_18025 [Catenovulum sp. 2E275]|uniref:hypothetical protein n=1 Tax=Catenovulum sp. 2E275 TaxID=2980497 RepID=UPI0021CFAF44|nr:hypothetical protein [Catenovulum sp. 2E275]MCU4677525.1 hypothetical protein [Catenovulum sp. 2E275]
MLKTLRAFSLAAILLPAFAMAADKASLINEIVDKSGLTTSLESLPAQFQAQAMQQKPYVKDPQAVDSVMQILSNNVDKHEIKQTLVDTFDSKMSVAELKEVKSWLDSDLGSQIAKAELEAADPANMQEIQMFAASFQTQPPTQERIVAVQNFVEKSKLVDAAMNMVEQIMSSTISSIEKFSDNPDMAKVEDAVAQAKGMIQPMLWQQMILMSHYTYQDLSVEQINQYTDYLVTDSGKKYLQTGIDGVTAVINQIMEKSAPQIKEAAQAYKKG